MRLIHFILYVVNIYGCTGCRLEIEAEYGTSTGGAEMFRSQASNGATVLLNTPRDNITFTLEVISTLCNELTVTDVRYSNDGLSDVVDIFLNTSKIGQFTSKAVADNGDGWNVFQSSGQIGIPVQIQKGVYNLQIQLFKSLDEYGIEIDKVSLQFICSSVNINNECPESVIKVARGSIMGTIPTTDTTTTKKMPATDTATTPTTGSDKSDTEGLSTKDKVTISTSVVGSFVGLAGLVIAAIGLAIPIYRCYNNVKSKRSDNLDRNLIWGILLVAIFVKGFKLNDMKFTSDTTKSLHFFNQNKVIIIHYQ